MSYDPTKPYKFQIQTLISKTWKNPYVRVSPGIYPVLTKKFTGQEVDHTDGIGTKGFYHWQARTFREAVIDSLAMNLNDLALVRAVPYKIQNHLTLPADDHTAILQIVKHLSRECSQRHIAITGGETSVHNNSDSLDISVSMSGVVKDPKPNLLKPGLTLIGLKSSGLHSNGFSLVRRVFGDKTRPEFVKPTAIYLDKIIELSNSIKIYGMMHITGGAFTKLKDILDGADAVIDKPPKPQPIFEELYKQGIKDEEMYKTFNCGVGFVLGVKPADIEATLKVTGGKVIGRVAKGTGKVQLTSSFSGQQVEF